MIEFSRYPHVGKLFRHYAKLHGNSGVTSILNTSIKDKNDAEKLCRFAIFVVDCIASDMESQVSVLGSKDNTSVIPDIDYEVNLITANAGHECIWDDVCGES